MVRGSVRGVLPVIVVVVSIICPLWAACPEGDFNDDCRIDFEDVWKLASQWLYPPGSSADLDGLNGVEGRDFAIMAKSWSKPGIPLVINEFLASNNGGARDPQGQDDDWIEIYNAGDQSVDVGGMHLTDNLDRPTKWQIPISIRGSTTIIQPGGFLLIWADNDVEDNGTDSSGLHAAFQLSASNDDEIGLFDITGTILIDKVEFPKQQTNISFGRFPNGAETLRFFGIPSPRMPNIGAYDGFISNVKLSHTRGFYDAPFSVTIACETEGVQIYYSLNGTEPGLPDGRTVTGTPYTVPIAIDGTTCLRVVAHKPGWKSSKVETHTYLFVSDIITQSLGGEAPGPGWPNPGSWNGQLIDYGMDPAVVQNARYASLMDDAMVAVPTLSIVTKLAHLFDLYTGIYVHPGNEGPNWERPASLELINPDGSKGFQIDAGIRVRGGYSRSKNNPKHAFRVLFGSEYGGRLKFPLFEDEGTDEFANIDIRCSQNYSWSFNGSDQNSAVREVYSRDLQGETGHPYTRSRYYHLYLNGHYWGLFQTQERSEASFAESYFGGRSEDYDVMKANRPSREMWPTDGDTIAYRRLYDATRAGFQNNAAYYRVQGLNPDGTPNPNYEKLLDVDNLIDFMIIEYYTGDRDGPGSRFGNIPNNIYCIYNRVNPEGWIFYHHDNEHTLGVSSSETNMVTPFTSAGSQFRYFNPHWMHEQIAPQNADYRMHFADHVYKHFFNGGLLTESVSQARVIRRRDQIELAIIAESARWGDSKRSSPFTKDEHWVPEINELLNNYIPPRTTVVLNQLKSVGWYPSVQPPTLNPGAGHVAGGTNVTLSGSGGTIYYTDDGSDPRRNGGSVSPAAKVYSQPININMSTILKARARSGGDWSPLAEAAYAVGDVADSLRITEIMYHPKGTGDPEDPNKEFIELQNIRQEPINLNLVRFTNGIDFTFGDVILGAGEYIVVVRKRSAFEAEYPEFSGVIAGEYLGSLNNGGERIELEDVIGKKILDFSYKDGWRDLTDGRGYSLTIIDTNDSGSFPWDSYLAAHWKLDDAAGAAAADSAGDNDGILYGDPTWVGGRSGGALEFDGDEDHVAFPSLTALVSVNMTASAWVRLSSAADAWNPIVMQHNDKNDGYRFHIYEDKLKFSIIAHGRGTVVQVEVPEPVEREQWHHFAATNDGADLRIYFDGELKDKTASVGYEGLEHEGYIGRDITTGKNFNGLIDDVRVYSRALSDDEILTIANPTERWGTKDSWRASAYAGGSPGEDDYGRVPAPGAVVINEILAHSHAGNPDWIELYNTTDDQIDIGGWYLSDGAVNLKKYRISDGTMIPAHGYIVFYEDMNFGKSSPDPGRITGFALSENGEQVSLTCAKNGVLTGYREKEDFGASETGISFGRYFKASTGNFNFVSLQYATPGMRNWYPKVGPVVINEIMYNPDWVEGAPYTNDQYEFVELKNISPFPVTLYDEKTGEAWKFTSGVDFTFPESPDEVTLRPGEHLVVVMHVAAFRYRYPTVPPDAIFGPFTGQLNNGGETLELSKSGDIDQFGRRQYIRVDRVKYSDGSHPGSVPGGVDLWPTEPDGAGSSLNRILPANYSNDPNNWQADLSSPASTAP